MIGELIKNYGDIGALGVFVLLMAWYLRYQTQRQAKREDKQDEERAKRQEKRDEEQKEEREFYRNLVTNDLKSLHNDSMENAKLNTQSIVLLNDISENQSKLCKLIEDVNRRINGQKQ